MSKTVDGESLSRIFLISKKFVHLILPNHLRLIYDWYQFIIFRFECQFKNMAMKFFGINLPRFESANRGFSDGSYDYAIYASI